MTELTEEPKAKTDHSALLRELYSLNIEIKATGNEALQARFEEVQRLLQAANLL